MDLRIAGNDVPDNLLKGTGAIANGARLRVKEVQHDPSARTVSFPLERFPIVGGSLFSGTRHSRTPVRCRVSIRNVTDCKVEGHTKEQETVRILFGLRFTQGEVFLCSAEEDRGITCYTLSCRVSELDIEIRDE